MELYEAKDLPSSDLSNQHVDDDSNSEVNRRGVPKVNGYFLCAVDCTFLDWGGGRGGGQLNWQRIRIIKFYLLLI